MNAAATSIFISRIRGLAVLDGAGDEVGRLRDVVIQVRAQGRAPRAKGLVVELFARRSIFIPMARVHNIDALNVYISGVVNTGKFTRQSAETLVIGDLFDRRITRRDHAKPELIFDVAMKQVRNREWELSQVALREVTTKMPFANRGHVSIVDWSEVPQFVLFTAQSTDHLVAQMADMKAADIARELHDMTPKRRAEVVAALDDQLLAEALEELPEDEQVQLIQGLDSERAADVLEEMDPDDAADLIAELAPDVAENLLDRMEPEEASDVRRLLIYEESTAGGMMTPEPIIVAPDATVADALAHVRNEELTPAQACAVFVCRPPLDAPTGKFLGGVHFQRLLREPPSLLVSSLIDATMQPLRPDSALPDVSRYFATYNLVNAPVVDNDGRLVGAVTVDDLLDHMLPDDWRGYQLDGDESAAEAVTGG